MKYAPLHVHSDASLDGAGTVQSLVSMAKKLELSHLALTDHGTLANAVSFWSSCLDADIVPILGMEAYLLYEGQRYHVTLLSMNEDGFNNLVYLDTDAHVHNFSGGYPLVTLDSMEKYKDGIFALTGCASSALFRGNYNDAKLYVAHLADIYGRENVALETMFVGSHNTWERPLSISKELLIPHVVTNDTHYPCKHQFPAHQAITKARRGFTYDSEQLWLKSAEEIIFEGKKWTPELEVREGLLSSMNIASRVEPWDMRSKPTLPSMPNSESELRVALQDALRVDVWRSGHPAYRKTRLQMEWKILKEKGFLDYIYILWDIVKWAKGKDIYVGPGRGSGGGSYVLYLLGITAVDPIEHGLLFERFINPSRADYPDVDVDFEADRRAEVMEYAKNRWDAMPIATYSCYSHKSAVHDIARVLHIPKDLEVAAADSETDSAAFRKFINDKPDAANVYNTMLGQIRHRGKHAAGVIIPNRPVPIERSGDELVAAWAEGMNTKELSKIGIVKYDLLGLTALSQLRRMKEITGVTFPVEGYSDRAVYQLFCDGDVAGIFQWSGSDGIRELTQRIAPQNFYDLTTCNALYRPGALHAGTAEDYPEYMRNPRKLHARIDPLLENTYGVICYQEQVMSVVAEVTGGDLAEADIARRLLSKAAVGDPKWEAEIRDLQRTFMADGAFQGFDVRLLEQLWHEIYTHSGYSYNLAHATTYTMISFQMAWYKVHHRPAFTVAVLQYDRPNAQTYMLDAIASGLQVMMPHVNYSNNQHDLVHHNIFLPLNDIAFLGEKGSEYIIEERKKNGAFVSYADFDKRIPKKVCNNRARQLMERIGAFDKMTGNPEDAIKDYASIPVRSSYQNQLEILGYVIPKPSLIRKMDEMLHQPCKKNFTRFVGFVSGMKRKKSVHGEYLVYTLSPSGSFWTRNVSKVIPVGTFVSGTKSHFGHSNDVKSYRLT